MKRKIAAGLASLALLLTVAGPAQEMKAQDTPQTKPTDPRAELKGRMKQRIVALDRLRAGGKVGETYAGLVDVVKSSYAKERVDPADSKSGTIDDFLEAENKDRKALFELIAKETKVTAAEVGKQNGIRSLEKANDDHWLKLDDGRWVQKKSVKPARK